MNLPMPRMSCKAYSVPTDLSNRKWMPENSRYGDGTIGIGIGIDKTNGNSTPIPIPTPTPRSD